MTLAAGSVTVAADETHAGSGLALVLYLADKGTTVLPVVPLLGQSTGGGFVPLRPCTLADRAIAIAARLTMLRELARRANAYAQIAPYLAANAVTTVTVSVGGLQRTPNPNAANAPTIAPASPVVLTGGLT